MNLIAKRLCKLLIAAFLYWRKGDPEHHDWHLALLLKFLIMSILLFGEIFEGLSVWLRLMIKLVEGLVHLSLLISNIRAPFGN